MDTRRLTFRLYPTPSQAAEMERQRVLHQRLYNAALEHRISAHRHGTSVGLGEQAKAIKKIRSDDPDYAGLHFHTVHETLKRLDRAFQNFFRRCKAGQTPGFPRFQSKDRFSGWAYKEHGNGFRIALRDADARGRVRHGRIRLYGIGEIPMRGSLREPGEIKTCNIVKRNGQWFASAVIRGEFARTGGTEACGLDWGVETFATIVTGDGEVIEIENPRHGRQTAAKLAEAQQVLARRKRRSKRRLRAKVRVQRLHRKLRNQRHDFQHKTSAALARRFKMIGTEQLTIKNMTASAKGTVEQPGSRVAQKAGLNREILDTAPAAFLGMLRYKAESAGGKVIEIDTRKHKPSQTDPFTGEVRKKPLSQRVHITADGQTIGRDIAAAMVILNVVLRQNGKELADAA